MIDRSTAEEPLPPLNDLHTTSFYDLQQEIFGDYLTKGCCDRHDS